MIENANTPPGPQHPRDVGDQGVGVGDELERAEGGEDDVERRVAERHAGGRRTQGGYDDPVLLVDAPAVLELPHGHVDADRPAAVDQDPARALAGPAADLEHVPAVDLAERVQIVLADALGTPQEAVVAEELPVRGLVLVGVRVPVGTVGPQRLRLVDLAPLGAYT